MAAPRRSAAIRCPACGVPLGTTVPPACPSCKAAGGGAIGRQLITLDQRMATLAADRFQLLARLRAEANLGVDPSDPPPAGLPPPPPAGQPPRTPATTPNSVDHLRHELRGGRQTSTIGRPPSTTTNLALGVRGWLATAGPQTLLASGGVLLLAIAAVVFAAVTWRDLSLLTRGGVLLAASASSAWLTRVLVHRGLRRSAEATSVLAVALLAVLTNGLWRAGLLDWVGDVWTVALVATTALAAISHGLARSTTVRAPFVLASWFASTACVATGQTFADLLDANELSLLATIVVLAGVLGAALTAAAYAQRFLDDLPQWRDATQVAAALLWVVVALGVAAVLGDPWASPSDNPAGFVAALVLAAAAVGTAALARGMRGHARRWDAAGLAGMWFAATLVGAAALLDRVASWPDAAVVVPLVLGAAALRLLRTRRTRTWAVVGIGPIGLAALYQVMGVIAWLSEIVTRRISTPWTLPDVVAQTATRAPDLNAIASALVIVAVMIAIAVAVARTATAAAYALTVAALTAVAAGVHLWPTGGGAVVAAGVVAAAAVGVRLAARRFIPAVTLAGASVAAALTALSTPTVTIVTLAGIAAVSTVAVGSPGRRARAVAAAIVTADLVALVAAVTAASTDGPGPVAAAVATAAGCGWAVAAALRARPLRALAVEVTAAAAFACAIVTAASGPAVSAAIVYAVLAVAAAGVAVRRADRRWLRWVATGAASASSWTLLADLDIGLVEAYTMPPALVIIALAASGLRVRPSASSWPVMGTGLTLLTMPTVLQLVDDPGDLRRLAVSIVLGSALAVVGRLRALQSPLVIGVATLTLAALSQYEVITDLLPRWLLLAAAGTLLLWLSISYERQRERVAAAHHRLATMR
ncbi:hypothetical protein BH23ACT10_BH23ACT10_34790 [soil metagenome]